MEADEELPDPWTLFRDRSSCIDGSGAGLILTNLKGAEFTYTLRFRFDATNNEAEYEALIAGLRIAKQMGVKNLQANVESRLISNQGDTWMTPIYNYLTEEILPAEKEKARAVRRKSRRFGLPGEIISDNGKQFKDNPFKDWCEKLCICQCFAFVKHPQANGLLKRANRSLKEGIMARLDERSKDWIEELSHVLWSHRTMIKSSNGDTSFLLAYETEAAIPAEIGMPTMRTMEVDIVQNDEALQTELRDNNAAGPIKSKIPPILGLNIVIDVLKGSHVNLRPFI
nr:reverse transcriptase domain-containing protein [Tanacetum cinerariifolium]